MSEIAGQALYGGASLYVAGLLAYRVHRRIVDTPTATASSAAIGRVELRGVARGDPAQAAPVTGRACAYWEAELWERYTPKEDRHACVVTERSAAKHLFLEDATGRIPVLVADASWTFERTDEFSGALPDSAQAFLARHGKQWDPQTMRLKERRIDDGSELYVLGTLSEARDAARGRFAAYRFGVVSKLAWLLAPATGASWLARRAGYAGVQTARAFGVEPEGGPRVALNAISNGEVPADSLAPESLLPAWLPPHRVVVWKGGGREPFVIANCPEPVVADGLAQVARWGVIGGSIAILVGIADLIFG
jgi:hypothetical protein